MRISEKQINELIMVSHVYLRLLEDLSRLDDTILSISGKHNKFHVAELLQKITNQQSQELKTIKDNPFYINQPDELIPVKCFRCETEFLVQPMQNMNTGYVTDCELHRKEG